MSKQRSRDLAETSKPKFTAINEVPGELMAVYEERGYKVRRLEEVRCCGGEREQLVVSGLDNFRVAISEPHDFAVVALTHPDWLPQTEELMCLACLRANAEGWTQ